MAADPATAGRVLALLTAAAERGDECPKNGEIADLVGSSTVSAGANWVAKLEARGLIRVERGNVNRVVTIVATGKRTAGTVGKNHWRLADKGKAARAAQVSRQTKALGSNHAGRSASASNRIESYPEPVERDPCFMCGTRQDIGCRHRPSFTASPSLVASPAPVTNGGAGQSGFMPPHSSTDSQKGQRHHGL